MVRQCQVIVYGFGASDKTGWMTGDNRIVRKLFDRIHRIISTDIDKSFYVQFVQDGKNLFIDFSVFMDFRQFEAA